ncbi:unnamed protein product [Merluccius merluccius]
MCAEDDRRAALKTCMKCEISMCVQHLQPHLTTPVLLVSHPLTEPMAPRVDGLVGTKCPQHGKLFEYYCLDDLTSVCVSCAIEDQHRLHNMKTLPKAHAELVEKLADGERDVAARRLACGTLGKWEKVRGEELGRSSTRLVEAVSKLRDVALSRVRSSVSARMGSVATGESSLAAAKGSKDPFRFLQLYSQVQRDVERAKSADLRMGLETGEERDKLVQELQDAGTDMMAQATQLWDSVLMFVDPENHQVLSGNAKVTFDPSTLGTGMSLSEDHRKVFYSNWSGTFASHRLMIKNSQSKITHKWVIAVSEDCDWTIGLTSENQQSSNESALYALCIQDGQLSYQTTEEDKTVSSHVIPGARNCAERMARPKTVETTEEDKTVSSHVIPGAGDGAERMARPKTVEVHLDIMNSSVSFYTRSSLPFQRRLIVSIGVSRSSGSPLNPFVKLSYAKPIPKPIPKDKPKDKPKVAFGSSLPTPVFERSNCCSCGKDYSQQSHGYRCDCGRVAGSTPITDLLCELL